MPNCIFSVCTESYSDTSTIRYCTECSQIETSFPNRHAKRSDRLHKLLEKLKLPRWHSQSHICLDLMTSTHVNITTVGLWHNAYPKTHPSQYNPWDKPRCTTVYILHSFLWHIYKEKQSSLCYFLFLLHWLCLCLSSVSAPDAFLDILSQEIIRFSLPADISAEPGSDAELPGGT